MTKTGILWITLFSLHTALAVSWPVFISDSTNNVTVFPPQPDKTADGILFSRAAISVENTATTTTVHGVAILLSNVTSNETSVTLNNFNFQNLQIEKLPEEKRQPLLDQLNKEASNWKQELSPEALGIMLNLSGQTKDKEEESAPPKTTTVDRDEHHLAVTYQGGVPDFVAIENTNLKFAKNSAFQVLQEENIYFCADRGVWYAATDPNGPWNPTDRIPRDVRKIPPSHPMYNTRFLYVGSQNNNQINYGFYPGYLDNRQTWGRLGGWGIDFQSPDYSIRVDPWNGSLIYREHQTQQQHKPKNWGRNYSKFPEFED